MVEPAAMMKPPPIAHVDDAVWPRVNDMLLRPPDPHLIHGIPFIVVLDVACGFVFSNLPSQEVVAFGHSLPVMKLMWLARKGGCLVFPLILLQGC